MQTGIGHLIADRHLWGLAGHVVQRRAAALLWKWRLHVRQADALGPVASKKAPAKPLGGHTSRTFLSFVHTFQKFAAVSVPTADIGLCRAVAVKAVLLGFTCPQDLAGTEETDIEHMLTSPAGRVLFMRMVAVADSQRRTMLKRKAAVLCTTVSLPAASLCSTSLASSSSGPSSSLARSSSASTLAATVKEIDPDKLQTDINELLKQWEVPVDKGTPAANVTALANARSQGQPVEQVLLARAAANRLDCKRSSRAQVTSALRLWHQFAVNVLAYSPEGTLPPSSGQDIEAFVCVFRNPDTAGNYVSHLRWACDHMGVSKAWDTEAVKATLRGAKRRKVRLHGGPHGAKRLLNTVLLQQLVAAADAENQEEIAVFCLVAWHYLLRVQSECIPLQAGSPADARGLAPGRHSGLWVEASNTVFLRLKVRKLAHKAHC